MKSIFYNAKFYTMDEKNSIAEAILAEEGMIRFVGSKEEIMCRKDDDTQMIDLEGRTVIPGFNDSHMHLLGYGKSLSEVDLSGAKSIGEVIERGRNYLKTHSLKPGQWLLGAGWNHEMFQDKKMIGRHDLDKISSDIPIVFSRVCHHIAACNSKALEIAGLTAASKIKGGEMELSDGEPAGVLKENDIGYILRAMPGPSREETKGFIQKGIEMLSSFGITSVHTDDIQNNDADEIIGIYKELEAEGKLKVRICQQCRFDDPKSLQAFIDSGYSQGINRGGSGNRGGSCDYRIGPLKILLDGSLGGHTAAMNSPYEDDPGNNGILNISEETLYEMVKTAHRNNMPAVIHAIGDRAVDLAIKAIEQAREEDPAKDVRHGIIHCQITSRDASDRMAKFGIAAYIQPIFVASDSKIVEKRVGRERAEYSYNWKTLIDTGVAVTFGTDCPIETPNPFENIFCAVNRCDMEGNPAGGWLPGQKLTVGESVRAYTQTSAWAGHEESIKGTIQPGKYADMAVLSRDIFDVDPMGIKDIECIMTIKGGEIAYQKSI